VFLGLGLLSGLLLVLSPFGLGAPMPSQVTWVMFPLLTLTGYLLLGMGARLPTAQMVAGAASAAMLVLSVVSAAGLLIVSNMRTTEPADLSALWFVLAIGLLVGLAGISLPVFRRPTT
jgi:hypothetical protein